jgi:hypothetical protein
MKIAILEICTHTHYSAVNGLIKTYSVDPNNTIVLYTNESIAKAIYENGVSDNTMVVVFKEGDNVRQFLKNIENTPFHRIHICTIEAHFNEFEAFKPNVQEVIFHVHDIDIWFDSTWKNNIKNYFSELPKQSNKLRMTARFMRDVLVRNRQRDHILENMRCRKHRFIVHSEGQKKYLSEFVSPINITMFPFAINEGDDTPLSKNEQNTQNNKIRICIPGIVTDTRRDYTGLFKIMDSVFDDIKDKLVFDFLGFVEKSEPQLLAKMQEFEQRGLEVIYYTEFVFGKKFDNALAQADILLNNQIVVVSHTKKYGVSKESGMIFNMIRGSKPGIFPTAYAVDKVFEDSLLYYNSDKELKDIILGLAKGSINMRVLRTNAEEMAFKFTPKNLYGRLVREQKQVPQLV